MSTERTTPLGHSDGMDSRTEPKGAAVFPASVTPRSVPQASPDRPSQRHTELPETLPETMRQAVSLDSEANDESER